MLELPTRYFRHPTCITGPHSRTHFMHMSVEMMKQSKYINCRPDRHEMENGSCEGGNVKMGEEMGVGMTMSLSYAMSKRNFVVLDKVQHSAVREENSNKKKKESGREKSEKLHTKIIRSWKMFGKIKSQVAECLCVSALKALWAIAGIKMSL